MATELGIPGFSGSRTIISVFPLGQSLELRHEGIKIYEMPPAKKGEVSVLRVNDTFAWCRNFHAPGIEFYQARVSAQQVAENLIQSWSRGLIGTGEGLGPGILICAGLEPTQAEVDAANHHQEDYFAFLINQADLLFAQDKSVDITSLHRVAAEWMGTQDREWFHPITRIEMQDCPECGERIRAKARKCRWCHTIIKKAAA
jgi:hypothetical protein